ncbi:protein Mis18-alpha-like protein [Cricetulus griseus]|nr:protein Mis18-alpha-like protein [Cricetulus griseus]
MFYLALFTFTTTLIKRCRSLPGVSSNVSVDKEQKLSKCKDEDGCILETLSCTGCSLSLGYVYKCTPKNLDYKRDLFCLSVEAIERSPSKRNAGPASVRTRIPSDTASSAHHQKEPEVCGSGSTARNNRSVLAVSQQSRKMRKECIQYTPTGHPQILMTTSSKVRITVATLIKFCGTRRQNWVSFDPTNFQFLIVEIVSSVGSGDGEPSHHLPA